MEIPILDLKGRSAEQLRGDRELGRSADEGLSTVGTFVLCGHGVPGDILSAVRSTAEDFFAEPESEKQAWARPMTPEVARGYFGLPSGAVSVMGMERFSFGTWERDESDSYYSGSEGRAHFPDNRFPPQHAAFESAARAYFRCVEEVSHKLAVILEEALQLKPGTFTNDLKGNTGTATAILYPGGGVPPEGGVRIQAHNDVDLYTILRIFDDSRTDLYFLDRENRWNEVPAVRDSFIVNVGDLMQRYTNDRWLATSHKVLVPPQSSAQDRFSLAYFEHPRYDATVAPLEALLKREKQQPAYPAARVADFERQRRMLIHLGQTANEELLEPIEKRLGSA